VNAQRASLEFQALTEVRNKLLNAYQEIMRMQV
ncbi:MAG: flagellar hook-basal body complex protein FliE, partial [Parahaliea sp.]